MVSMHSRKPVRVPSRLSDVFPNAAFETVPMFVWLTMVLLLVLWKKLVSSCILTSCQLHRVTSVQITSKFFHTSFETQVSTSSAKSWLVVLSTSRSTASSQVLTLTLGQASGTLCPLFTTNLTIFWRKSMTFAIQDFELTGFSDTQSFMHSHTGPFTLQVPKSTAQ